MADSGFMQINDQILNIPPEQISVQKNSLNNKWQTLRTRSSIKAASGFSQLNISIVTKFTDTPTEGEENGYLKLRNLVSQFRVTPFCYVENQYLRNTILGGNTSATMALALKQMEISKTDQSTNVLTVVFHFGWFNYFPYVNNFSFKEDIFVEKEVLDPRESKAFRLLYLAEQKRPEYKKVPEHPVIASKTALEFYEHAMISKSKWQEFKRETDALKGLQKVLNERDFGGNDTGELNLEVISNLIKYIGDETTGLALNEKIFGNTTSMLQENPAKVKEKLLDIINKKINPDSAVEYRTVVQAGWEFPVGDDGNLIKMPTIHTSKPTQNQKESDEDVIYLMRRKRNLILEDNDLIVTGISISFENILAAMPVVGHHLPSYQHIGSIDAVVTLSIMTTNNKAVQELSKFYSSLENQSYDFKLIPQGQRNLVVTNALINLVGLETFVPENITMDTVPGQPGTTSIVFSLCNDPLTSYTREELSQGQSFTSSESIRKKIVDAINKNLVIAYKPDESSKTEEAHLAYLERQSRGRNFYKYKSSKKTDRDFAFRDLTTKYGKEMSKVISQIATALLGGASSDKESLLTTFFSFSDEEIVGIERMQEDLLPFFKKTPKAMTSFSSLSKGEASLKVIRNEAKTKIEREQQAIKAAVKDLQRERPGGLLGNPGDVASEELSKKGEDLLRWANYITPTGNAADPFFALRRRLFIQENFVRDYLSEWQSFIVNFIDIQILATGLDYLPQFKDAREAMNQNFFSGKVSNTYPDFPLEQIRAIIQSNEIMPGEKNNYKTALNFLKSQAEVHQLQLKNITADALISPDFYFYYPGEGTRDRLIPKELEMEINNIVLETAVKRSRTEADWFRKIYEGNILGKEKILRVAKDFKSKNDESFWADGGDKEKAARIQELDREINSSADNLFYEGDLIPGDKGIGLGSSLTELDDISFNKIGPDEDPFNLIINERKAGSYKMANHWNEVKHVFTSNSISSGPVSTPIPSNNSSSNSDDGSLIFQWPVPPPFPPRITSRYGWRTHPDLKIRKEHTGIDIAHPSGDETPILATANGKIYYAHFPEAKNKMGEVRMTHPGGYKSRYQHLKADERLRAVVAKYKATGAYEISRGDIVGTMGDTDLPKIKGSDGRFRNRVHLHFEIRQGKKALDPITKINAKDSKMNELFVGLSKEDSLLSKSIEQFEKEFRTEQGYTMARAYPTFRLYFIESDMGERKRFLFDDFFAYSSVKEIQLIRSRKLAADLCTIQLTNISGALSNRRFTEEHNPEKARTKSGQVATESKSDISKTNTVSENPIASLMLQPGVQIQLRLGYSSNPQELETVFNGVITDVQFTDTDDLVTIVCQSFAIEMVQQIHGEEKSYGGFLSTSGKAAKILEDLMASPEMVHFGRWERGGSSLGLARKILTDRWTFQSQPQDDNIFAPTGESIWGLFDWTPKYVLYNSTIWDVFQEMMLRYPSYVALPVPYEERGGNPRMTMFFGVPDQLYFARDPGFKEDLMLKRLQQEIDKAVEKVKHSNSAIDAIKHPVFKIAAELTPGAINAQIRETLSSPGRIVESIAKSTLKKFALDRGFIKPFRSYHILTSGKHILSNNISSSAYNTFNTVTLQYSNSAAIQSGTLAGARFGGAQVNQQSGELEFGDIKTLTMKQDAAIADEDVREVFAQYPNCLGEEMARRYAVSILQQSAKEGYKGNIIIIGNPRIKPTDICFIADEYSDIFGPIEVEQVVHRFSQQNGFITEITPDFVVHVNQHSTMATTDAMGMVAEYTLKTGYNWILPDFGNRENFNNLAGTVGKTVMMNPISQILGATAARGWGITGALTMYKLMTRTQLAHPFRYDPLIKNGKPMIGGLPNKKTYASFLSGARKFLIDADENIPTFLQDTWDRLHISRFYGASAVGDFGKTYLKF